MLKLKTAAFALCLGLLNACSQEPEPNYKLSLDTVIDLSSTKQVEHLPELFSELNPNRREALGEYLDLADQDKLSPDTPNWYDEPVTYGQAVEMLSDPSFSELQAYD